MNEKVNIRKVFGKYQVEFHPFTGCFYCKIGDVEFRDESYNLLLNKIKHSKIVIIDEPILYKSSMGFERKRIMRLDYFKEYFYDDEERQQRIEDAYPMTKKNEEVMKESQKMNDEGWKLIRKGESYMKDNLEEFPENHWEKVFQKKIQSLSDNSTNTTGDK